MTGARFVYINDFRHHVVDSSVRSSIVIYRIYECAFNLQSRVLSPIYFNKVRLHLSQHALIFDFDIDIFRQIL